MGEPGAARVSGTSLCCLRLRAEVPSVAIQLDAPQVIASVCLTSNGSGQQRDGVATGRSTIAAARSTPIWGAAISRPCQGVNLNDTLSVDGNSATTRRASSASSGNANSRAGEFDLLPAVHGGDSCRAHAAPRRVPASLATVRGCPGLTLPPPAVVSPPAGGDEDVAGRVGVAVVDDPAGLAGPGADAERLRRTSALAGRRRLC